MATTTVNGVGIGTALTNLLMSDDIEPGSDVSYQLCTEIYTHHPLGKKLVDTPIALAQSQAREIAIAGAPERVKERFSDQWREDGCDGHIFNLGSVSRRYGVGAIGILIDGFDPKDELDFKNLADKKISFNVWDALNLAGSQVLNLDPNSMDFMKSTGVAAAGTHYHRSRAIVKYNEKPVYLSYTSSGFGFNGRSVYQRALFPLKAFIETMIADAMVARKAGLLVAKMKPPGSIMDRIQSAMYGIKRAMIQWGATNNVLGITPEESIESLNLQNVNGAMSESRKNILDNTATAADMPAIILNQETFAEGFGEGIEDAKSVARYIGAVRAEFDPVYAWFDEIEMHRAWSPAFYATIQRDFPDQYGEVSYDEAFYEWKNAFKAIWPSLIEEPESEAVRVADTKLKAAIALVQVLLPEMDPQNKARVIEWCCDNFNSLESLFKAPLELDLEALAEYEPPTPEAEPGEPRPFAAQDGVGVLKRLARAAA